MMFALIIQPRNAQGFTYSFGPQIFKVSRGWTRITMVYCPTFHLALPLRSHIFHYLNNNIYFVRLIGEANNEADQPRQITGHYSPLAGFSPLVRMSWIPRTAPESAAWTAVTTAAMMVTFSSKHHCAWAQPHRAASVAGVSSFTLKKKTINQKLSSILNATLFCRQKTEISKTPCCELSYWRNV